MNEAEIVVSEPALAAPWSVRRGWRSAVQALGSQNAPDAVAVEMGQEVGNDEGGVIEGEVGGAAECTDHGAFLVIGLPRQLMRCGRPIKAVGRAALAPFADGLGADAVALRQHTGGLGGPGDLGADGRGGPGIGMDLHHGLPPTRGTSGEALETVGIVYDRQPHRIPTMFRGQTGSDAYSAASLMQMRRGGRGAERCR